MPCCRHLPFVVPTFVWMRFGVRVRTRADDLGFIRDPGSVERLDMRFFESGSILRPAKRWSIR
ncbi:hypothetical protein HMPREF0762_00018 [Slackia exigua ATCC 700122]|uniref:Uncharacterized protein n=1 Tax=Slackia exigua (strain ATCC 700122 / DSM 15923 / CIP 105133 / JCM 11022 / KCTC 5966 / S-7) TaxID=649764 RepID=D0WDZ6_SLAES|nr:hypothetical protein HMPREF0762_00018 [Slackia exigua ATCC 700122]